MPAAYAHHRFGQDVRALLPPEDQAVLTDHAELFAIGLQGPDILFHYHPLRANPVTRLGHGMHERPGREFFRPAAEKFRRDGAQPRDLAYLLGFLCHFLLDTFCHGYVEERARTGPVSHVAMETAFDRMLMVRDGLDPLVHRPAAVLTASQTNAAVIAGFFPSLTAGEVRRAIRGMVRDGDLMRAPGRGKEALLTAGLKLAGQYETLGGLMVTRREDPRCREGTQVLWTLYRQAVPRGAALVQEYRHYLAGQGSLAPLYEQTFVPRSAGEAGAGRP